MRLTSPQQYFIDVGATSVGDRLAIGVAGGLTLSFAGQPVPLANRKARALLAYLALEEAPSVSRERLAGLFWSESSDRHAAISLRGALYEIRKLALPPGCGPLRDGPGDISLIRHAIDLDLETALAGIPKGIVPDRLLSPENGPEHLLAGYEDISTLFSDWIAVARAAAVARMLRALECGYANTAAPRADRRRLAEATLRLDRLHEGACRTVMQLAAEDGETGVALRAYAALYDAMDTELDQEPAEATQALVARIKQGQLGRARAVATDAANSLGGQRQTSAGVPIVAVLPLQPTGDDAMVGWIAEGVVEDVVRVLAGFREPMVISSNSTRHLTAPDLNLQHIAGQLGAQYLVTGRVRMVSGRGRISIELAEASNGAVLWGQAYNFTNDTIFDTQEAIAANIANTLAPQVGAAELRLSRAKHPEDLGAYHLLLRARERIFRLERSAFEDAGRMLHEAVERAPGYAGAYAALATWHGLRILQGWTDYGRSEFKALMDAAQEAIRLDPFHARALAIYGHNIMLAEDRFDDALLLFERAFAAAPGDADSLLWSSPTLAYTGQHELAIARASQALMLSPTDPFRYRHEHFLSIAHYVEGDFAQAANLAMQARARNRNYTSNLRIGAAALAAAGRIPEARHVAAELLQLEPTLSATAMAKGSAIRDPAKRASLEAHLLAAGVPA